MTELSFSSNYN